jgi:hypothetical protein
MAKSVCCFLRKVKNEDWKTLDIVKQSAINVQKALFTIYFNLGEIYWTKLCMLLTTYHYMKPLVSLNTSQKNSFFITKAENDINKEKHK